MHRPAVLPSEVPVAARLGFEIAVQDLKARAFRRGAVEEALDDVRRAKAAPERRSRFIVGHLIGGRECADDVAVGEIEAIDVQAGSRLGFRLDL